MSTVVYDAGALIAAEHGVERMWALHKRALARGVRPVVPATLLAEVWRGPGHQRLGHFVGSCDVEEFSEGAARAAGALLSVAAHAVLDASVVDASVVDASVVDASVAECALRLASPCVTGNRSHLVDVAGPRRIAIIDI